MDAFAEKLPTIALFDGIDLVTQIAADTSDYSKSVGLEPMPGYTLLEPLGRGGFGEVWKCEAPGGLHKAIKFVSSLDSNQRKTTSLDQEFEAFQQIKTIRHPFLLTLERVELIGTDLIMVMELADGNILDRYSECVRQGMIGIPRDELLGYLADASEALDMISTKHGLQHLDIKPANLFLVGDHVKVGDYGLVARLDPGSPASGTMQMQRGLTPQYCAPEVVRGNVDSRSDQYSLALVYCQMLTTVFPFKAHNPAQMLFMHATVAPKLDALPEQDRKIVARALSKKPEERFHSSLEFITALIRGDENVSGIKTSGMIRRGMLGIAPESQPILSPSFNKSNPTPSLNPHPTLRSPLAPATLRAPELPPLTVPGKKHAPQLKVQGRSASLPQTQPEDDDVGVVELIAAVEKQHSSAKSGGMQLSGAYNPNESPLTKLERIYSVVSLPEVRGEAGHRDNGPRPLTLAENILIEAAQGHDIPQFTGDPVRTPSGIWVSRILMKPVIGVARLKLEVLCENWGVQLTQPDTLDFLVRVPLQKKGFWAKEGGVEILIQLPRGTNNYVGESQLIGRKYGVVEADMSRKAEATIPQLMTEIRKLLQTIEDRRKSPRVMAELPLTAYPLSGDGTVFYPVTGKTIDVSRTGIRFETDSMIDAHYVYLHVGPLPSIDMYCILTRIVRADNSRMMKEFGGQYRTDF